MEGKMSNYIKFKSYRDYPYKGVNFIDFTPTYYDLKSRNFIINEMSKIIDSLNIDFNHTVIVAPDARGFIMGSILAHEYNLPLILVRKESKFPPESISVAKSYDTEYSTDVLAMQEYDLDGKTCLFIDDVFATGGTYNATKDLCCLLGADDCIPIVIYDVGISDKIDNILYSVFNQSNL